MKKTLKLTTAAFVLAMLAHTPAGAAEPTPVPPGGFQIAKTENGGFSGPGLESSSVEQARGMRDDAQVILRGNIVRHLGKDKYLFKDETGTINVEIDRDKWGGLTVTPSDVVELHGEVDKDWNSVEIDVDRVVKVR